MREDELREREKGERDCACEERRLASRGDESYTEINKSKRKR